MRTGLVATLVVLGCTAPDRPRDRHPDGDPSPSTLDTVDTDGSEPTDATTETGGASDTASDTAGSTPATNPACANLPAAPLAVVDLVGPRGYHGLAIDADGFMHGTDVVSLVKADAYGAFEVVSPNTGALQQLDVLPDGAIVAADSVWGSVVRFEPNGAKTTIANGLKVIYGLRVGPDGMIYTANTQEIHRIDPATGVVTVLIDPEGAFSPKVFDWSPDYTKLYVGTNSGAGQIYVFDIDVATMDPIGPPTAFATGTGGWHDCLDVDECGNLYVCDFYTRALWRVDTAGAVTKLVQWSNAAGTYGHGLLWGTGQHGWSETSIFQPQPYDGYTVVELDLGVRSRRAVAPAWP